jgi:hypothetical protein
MELVEELRIKIAANEFEFSKHAVDQSILREISVREIREAVSTGEIIEDYPDDKYGPSCLILGFTRGNRPVHIQCTYLSGDLVKIITVYEPDVDLWIDFQVRR